MGRSGHPLVPRRARIVRHQQLHGQRRRGRARGPRHLSVGSGAALRAGPWHRAQRRCHGGAAQSGGLVGDRALDAVPLLGRHPHRRHQGGEGLLRAPHSHGVDDDPCAVGPAAVAARRQVRGVVQDRPEVVLQGDRRRRPHPRRRGAEARGGHRRLGHRRGRHPAGRGERRRRERVVHLHHHVDVRPTGAGQRRRGGRVGQDVGCAAHHQQRLRPAVLEVRTLGGAGLPHRPRGRLHPEHGQELPRAGGRRDRGRAAPQAHGQDLGDLPRPRVAEPAARPVYHVVEPRRERLEEVVGREEGERGMVPGASWQYCGEAGLALAEGPGQPHLVRGGLDPVGQERGGRRGRRGGPLDVSRVCVVHAPGLRPASGALRDALGGSSGTAGARRRGREAEGEG
mmetsp:Transcript_70140/g.196561  ORF Transcript_70140/g.196561 Transcript_70140/m.196561 type:complete len:397 (-) Transcript_70140:489-1679(-)